MPSPNPCFLHSIDSRPFGHDQVWSLFPNLGCLVCRTMFVPLSTNSVFCVPHDSYASTFCVFVPIAEKPKWQTIEEQLRYLGWNLVIFLCFGVAFQQKILIGKICLAILRSSWQFVAMGQAFLSIFLEKKMILKWQGQRLNSAVFSSNRKATENFPTFLTPGCFGKTINCVHQNSSHSLNRFFFPEI